MRSYLRSPYVWIILAGLLVIGVTAIQMAGNESHFDFGTRARAQRLFGKNRWEAEKRLGSPRSVITDDTGALDVRRWFDELTSRAKGSGGSQCYFTHQRDLRANKLLFWSGDYNHHRHHHVEIVIALDDKDGVIAVITCDWPIPPTFSERLLTKLPRLSPSK
jgi:hypothetical protein